MLADFPVGTTKAFQGQITIGGQAPDIRLDAVTLRMKANKDDSDAEAVVTVSGNVSSQGLQGVYLMEIAPSQTSSVPPGRYYYDIVLVRANGAEYVLESGTINLLDRVSDA